MKGLQLMNDKRDYFIMTAATILLLGLLLLFYCLAACPGVCCL